MTTPPTPNAGDVYEHHAAEFKRETGHFAPGKDRPAAFGPLDAGLVLHDLWDMYWRCRAAWDAHDAVVDQLAGENQRANNFSACLDAADKERATLTAQLAAANALMIEAAQDIEYMVNAEYHGPDDVHPAMRAKYKRDIKIVGQLIDAARTGAR